jgi:DNA helicase-2/ATP-dependent DNA helicase PcrA
MITQNLFSPTNNPTIPLHQLNPQQRLAATTIAGPVLILAGAGSGKTRTVTFRIGHMICDLGIPSNQILAVSFTNKAALEMKERMKHLLTKSRKLNLLKQLTLSTFHSLGRLILNEELKDSDWGSQFTIYDSGDQLSVLREGFKLNKTDKAFDQKRILAKISFLKNKGLGPNEFSKSPFFDPTDPYDTITEDLYHYYQERLHHLRALDFDDLLYEPVKLLELNPTLAKKWSERFKYIMVDEYQDTNPLQFRLIKVLTSSHQNICVVGDDDQSIYGFRGADLNNILQFEKFFHNAQIIKLEENYRSTPSILNLANVIIEGVKGRKEKTMFSNNPDLEKPQLWKCADNDHETQVIMDEIKKLVGQGQKLSEIALLYRSNTQSTVIEDGVRFNNLPYKMIGGQKFYEKKEVKDMISYLSLIKNSKDDIALRRIINTPPRGIGNTTLQKYSEYCQTHKMSLFNAFETFPQLDPNREEHILKFTQFIYRFKILFKKVSGGSSENLTFPKVIEQLIEELKFKDYIEKSYDQINQQSRRKKDLDIFVMSAERFSHQFHDLGSQHLLSNFLDRILLAEQLSDQKNSSKNEKKEKKDNQNQNEENQEEEQDQLTLMTLHSSKGLEFDVVFLVGMEEELLPHKKSLEEGNLPEERRLCYVGVTRAKKKLIMTYCSEKVLYGKKVKRKPSRFVDDITAHYDNIDMTTLSHLTKDEINLYQNQLFGDLLKMLD